MATKAAPKNTAAKKAAPKAAATKKDTAARSQRQTKAPAKKATAAAPEENRSQENGGQKSPAKAPASTGSSAKAKPTKASSKASAPKAAPKPELPDYLTDPVWLEAQVAELTAERARYTKSAKSLADEAAQLMADREPGDVQFDEESGEGDTIAVERDRDLALSAKARESVDEIDAAFERIKNGTYGICVKGGDFIPKERLEAIPEASICVQHKTAMF
ncbi:MAG: hypothetical protein R2706_07260 [Acidimicrobiales bacterium]